MAVVRSNILTDSGIRDKYVQGVKLLKNDFLNPQWPNTYDIFVMWHYHSMMTLTPPNSSSGRNAAHTGPSFLPWHRWVLILLENHLQRVLGDQDFGLPYWDWAADGELPQDQQNNSDIWSDNCMGGIDSPVSSGPFRDGEWQVNMEGTTQPGSSTPVLLAANRGLQRSAGMNLIFNMLPTKDQVKDAVHRNKPNVIYDTSPWNGSSDGFRNELEGWINAPRLHNLVHVWIGGDMELSTSPNDPIFYLNHCNVDRVWAGWQDMHDNSSYLPDSNESSALLRHRINDRLLEITESSLFDPIYEGSVRPSDLLDVSSIYSYDTFDDLQ